MNVCGKKVKLSFGKVMNRVGGGMSHRHGALRNGNGTIWQCKRPWGQWALLLILSVLWGGSFFFIGVAVKELPPLTIMMLRLGIAALILHVVFRAMGQWMPRDPKVWLAFAGMGLLNNAIPQTLIVWGQTQIPSGLASILNATTPLFGVLVAHFFTTDEKMTGKKLAGVIVGFIGAAVMVGPAALQGLGTNVWAQVAILLASAFYGISGVYGRRFKEWGLRP